MADIELTNYDYEDLKDSLIAFLQTYDPKFADFNFKGSAIDTLVAILARNSHYDAYMANMVANESFIDTAQLFANVASHAQCLSYVPRSVTAATTVVDIEITPYDVPTEQNIELPAGSVFLSTVLNNSYTFITKSPYVLTYKSSRATFKATDITLYQGSLQSNKLIYSGSKLIIPNKRIDTSTLVVVVNETTASLTNTVFTRADTIQDLDPTANVYFLGLNTDGYYTLEFGKDLLGAEPKVNSIVSVQYIVVEQNHGNGVSNLTAATSVADYTDIAVTVLTPAYGGSEGDDIETVRLLAPKAYAAQNRCVTPDDYVVKLREQYPFIKHATGWGGEKADPPQYGSVLISVIADGRDFVSPYVKNEMVNFLTGFNVGSITPIIIDPTLIGINLQIQFGYDKTRTSKTFTQLAADVVQVVQTYSDSDLNDFDQYYNNSSLISNIRSIPGVSTVEIDKRVFTDLSVVKGTLTKYEFTFGNEVIPGSISVLPITINSRATEETIVDDEQGNLILTQVIDGITYKINIGSVNYTSGYVQFTTTLVNDDDYLQISLSVVADNVYLGQNKIGYINLVETSKIDV